MTEGMTHFRISKKAKSKVADLLKSIEGDPEFSEPAPVLMWINGLSTDEEFVPGPHVGLEEEEVLSKTYPEFYEFDGVKMYIGMDAARIAECKSKVLDYRQKRFVLIYPDDMIISPDGRSI